MSAESSCLVSVIIPTYGRSDYLKRAVDSVLNQTYEQTEIIVVDDNDPNSGSRTATEKVMFGYKEFSNVIYLRHEKNQNGAVARNTGIASSKGKYICFLDDDDEMLPDRIKLFVEKMESLDNTWVACYSDFIKLKPNEKIYCGEKEEGDLYLKALMRAIYFCPGSNLFARASAVKEIGGFDPDFRRNQDLEFLTRLLENHKIAYVDARTVIIHYEIRTGKSRSYADMIELDDFYLHKFENRIKKLPSKQQKKVYQYFALERFRYSIKKHEIGDGLKNCISNKVSLWLFFRYLFYMLHRMINKKSFGFNI